MPNPLTSKIAPVAIALTAGLVLGYGAGRITTGPSASGPMSAPTGGYAEGFEAAKTLALATGAIRSLPEELTTLEGTVLSLDGNSLMLETGLKSPNPFADQDLPARRRVRVTEKTEIVIQTRKTAAEIAADEQAFQKAVARGEQPSQQPNFSEKAGRLKDLKVGMWLVVTAAEDIKSAADFEALRIFVPLNGTNPTSGTQAVPPPSAPPDTSGIQPPDGPQPIIP
jgi:hypothetical protein